MESLRAAYRDEDDDDEEESTPNNGTTNPLHQTPPTPTTSIKEEPSWGSEEDLSDEENDDEDDSPQPQISKRPNQSDPTKTPSEGEDEVSPAKKHKPLSSLTPGLLPCLNSSKKPKKKSNVWAKSASRKGKKKSKGSASQVVEGRSVLSVPTNRVSDRSDDSEEMRICLSKVYKAEKVELGEDRLSAGSSKGYRMVRATRGVVKGAWYFEIKVERLGETGHTRLGWSTEKGDLQAPVGYDGNSFGYRDIDGSKIHKALREEYGEGGYVEGDVIGFYINLPDGDLYAPKTPWVWYKGQKYACPPNGKEEPNKVVPGSEVLFFKNGVCQGVAFKDICGGCYYPAASMYTLPNQPNCVVRFNFGPEFAFFPEDFGDRPIPTPMIEVPYQDFDGIAENGIVENGDTLEKKPQLSS